MTLPRSRIILLLVLLYAMAIWNRTAGQSTESYLYFKGPAGTNFRHAQFVHEEGRLPEVDTRAFWPDGYSPREAKPSGVEYVTGLMYSAFSLISDVSEKEFVRLFTVWLFALSVFSMYGVTRRLWACQGAGLFAAFLVAFFGPLVDVTDGKEFVHAPFVFLLVSLHLAALLNAGRRASSVVLASAAVICAGILGTWSSGGVYLGAFALVATFVPMDERLRRELLTGHLAAAVLAGIMYPHLRATRFLATWPVIVLLVCTLYMFASAWLPRRVPKAIYIAGGALLIWTVYRPLAGGAPETFDLIDVVRVRLGHLTGKPRDPRLLGEVARFLWTRDHAPPHPYVLLQTLLPLVFLLPPAILALPRIRRETRGPVWAVTIVAAVAIAMFAFDRSALQLLALTVFPLAGAAFYAFSKHRLQRGIPVALGVVLIAMQILSPFGAANATFRLAPLVGIQPQEPDGFLWLSLGNADRDLVRYMVSRTSTRDAVLATPDMSSLVATFAGRRTVLVPGIRTPEVMERNLDLTALMYHDEDALYAACDSLGVRWVLYSIDLLLDTSAYSVQYAAGVPWVERSSAVYMMHFEPERLHHFNLVFENDNYRLYRVTADMEPFFLTDHPPVYQKRIMDQFSDTLKTFYARIVDILVTYHTGVAAQAKGNDEDAILRFRYCLGIWPRFTRAWLGVGDSLMRLNDLEAANAAYMKVLEYAPDNPHALYYNALVLARMNRPTEALSFLQVLRSATRDPALLQRAQELETLLQTGGRAQSSE